MSKELCFLIEGKNLYMEQILVDYENVPIFYVCSDGGKEYLVLRRHMDLELYIIVEISLKNLSDMLHGKLSMREALMKEDKFWAVDAGDDVEEDEVVRKEMSEMPLQDLPYEGGSYQVADRETEIYVQQIDKRRLDNDMWESLWQSGWNTPADVDYNWLVTDLLELEIPDIAFEKYVTMFSNSVCAVQTKPLQTDSFAGTYERSADQVLKQLENLEKICAEAVIEDLADAA